MVKAIYVSKQDSKFISSFFIKHQLPYFTVYKLNLSYQLSSFKNTAIVRYKNRNRWTNDQNFLNLVCKQTTSSDLFSLSKPFPG